MPQMNHGDMETVHSLAKTVNKMDVELFGSEYGKKGLLKEFDERLDRIEKWQEDRHKENLDRFQKIDDKFNKIRYIFYGIIASTIASGTGTVSLKSLIEFLKHIGW